MHGGRRAGAGRPLGSVNRASRLSRERASALGVLPHEFLAQVARGETIGDHVPTFAERLDAAKAASPYFAARLAATRIESVATGLQLPSADCPEASDDGQLLALILQDIAKDSAAWNRLATLEPFSRTVLEFALRDD